MTGLFVTGTDTEIGKTHVSAALLRAYRRSGRFPLGLKPVASGDRHDAERLRVAAGVALPLDAINPVFLPEPLAPMLAAERAGIGLDPGWLIEQLETVATGFHPVVVEGAGGWRVPLTEKFWISDLAGALGLPVVVVASTRLGTINQTLLTVEAIRRDGMEVAGVVLNHASPQGDLATETNASLLGRLLDLPIRSLGYREEFDVPLPAWLNVES